MNKYPVHCSLLRCENIYWKGQPAWNRIWHEFIAVFKSTFLQLNSNFIWALGTHIKTFMEKHLFEYSKGSPKLRIILIHLDWLVSEKEKYDRFLPNLVNFTLSLYRFFSTFNFRQILESKLVLSGFLTITLIWVLVRNSKFSNSTT